MELQTHGARKYPTSELLRSSVGLGWSTISAELRAHGVSESPVVVPQHVEHARFSSQASFTRAFRRATGMTPAEYRRRRRSTSAQILSATPRREFKSIATQVRPNRARP
jgi:methylphosphotriester-DNA--protein-cysteine methyltransferase